MPRKRKDEATVGPRKRLNLDGTNHRNGSGRKRIATDDDLLDVEILRDREGTSDPVPIAKSDASPGSVSMLASMLAFYALSDRAARAVGALNGRLRNKNGHLT